MDPVVMVEQVRDFPRLNREYVRPFDQLVSDALTPLECLSLLRVVVTGDGDSYHAAHAAELAFECLGGVACEPLSAQRCRDYAVEWLPQPAPRTALVVGVSASGQTRRVVECLERARARHALTLALTGAPASPVAAAAECRLVVALPDPVPSPGLRTYHASLLGLLLLAIRLGEVRGRYHQDEANGLRRELAGLADVMAATIAAAAAPARAAAEALGDAPVLTFAGSGPGYGTALFGAAKVVEAAGVFAMGQDLEEWWHVERFAGPYDSPLVVVAPPGRSHGRAVELARAAGELGRRVVAVAREGDELARHARWVLPVPGDVREEFAPLVYHIGPALFAAALAARLGRRPFRDRAPEERAS